MMAAIVAGGVIVCCARLAEGFREPEGKVNGLAEVLNPFGLKTGVPPNHRTEDLTQSALAASEAIPGATPMRREAGCLKHMGGVVANTTLL